MQFVTVPFNFTPCTATCLFRDVPQESAFLEISTISFVLNVKEGWELYLEECMKELKMFLLSCARLQDSLCVDVFRFLCQTRRLCRFYGLQC